ncbi:unnamed protein product [Kuraishia capsulata CBS 1993]|uniref:Pre-mRNA-splicing factor 38 n=1 Tax=Kuraishia capsulata CBS 1993 TaxID=1382522 RepID=W6MI80_9ASCO|nr:uncharacterized protein KUCA_T00002105001 [Kuraishia capsulata CBS 1993]CDK26134.1 unnamed protein product [Kuraishia capsulata CBS 1993]
MSDTIIIDRGISHGAARVHGVNPVFLVEKIIRERILDSLYWKKDCFHLNALTILDKAVALRMVGTYSNVNRTKPCIFMCLLLKMLQIQPSPEIVNYLLRQPHFKYVTALAALYVRLTSSSVQVYKTLEPLLEDYRKLVLFDGMKKRLIHMDELVDDLLTKEKFCDLMMPRLVDRLQLEEQELIDPRESVLQEEFEKELEDGL